MESLDDDWKLARDAAHPNARRLLKSAFYWDMHEWEVDWQMAESIPEGELGDRLEDDPFDILTYDDAVIAVAVRGDAASRAKCRMSEKTPSGFARLAAALVCLAATLATGAPARFNDPAKLDQWMTYYYKRPEPAAMVDAMFAFSKQGALKNPETASPVFGFLAGVLSKNPAMAPAATHRLAALPPADQPVVVLGLWYSGHPDTKKLLAGLAKDMPEQRSMIEDLSRSTPPKLVELPLAREPWVLAALWGNFMATGDEAPVLRVVDALPLTMIAQGDPQRLAMGRTAEWSLASNAAQHPRVMEILRRQAKAQPGTMSNLIGRVIARAEALLKQEKAGKPR